MISYVFVYFLERQIYEFHYILNNFIKADLTSLFRQIK